MTEFQWVFQLNWIVEPCLLMQLNAKIFCGWDIHFETSSFYRKFKKKNLFLDRAHVYKINLIIFSSTEKFPKINLLISRVTAQSSKSNRWEIINTLKVEIMQKKGNIFDDFCNKAKYIALILHSLIWICISIVLHVT